MLIMIAQNNLDPNYVILGCFILIVLFLTGLIETAIQLFGNVSGVLYSSRPPPFSAILHLLFRFAFELTSDSGQRKQHLQHIRDVSKSHRRLSRHARLAGTKRHLQ